MPSVRLIYANPLINFFLNYSTTKNQVVQDALSDPTLAQDPLRERYVRSIPEAQIYKDVLLQGYFVPRNVLLNLEDFQVRNDDIFIITYPKSGTTWTEEIVSLICNGGDVEKVKNKQLIYRVEHLEVGRPFGHLRHLNSKPSPRLLATHLPLKAVPQQLREGKCKIIYIVRNPKDNMVSYYHHHKMSSFLGNFKGSWEEFFTHFMRGDMVYGSWFNHVLPFWHYSLHCPNKVLFVSYEELKIDLPQMVEKLALFLNKPLSSEAIQRICVHCSFDQMKQNKMVNREDLPVSDLFDMRQSKFMRKGIIGDWKNYFTPEQEEVFQQIYHNRMEDSGLELMFEPEEAIEKMTKHGRLIVRPQLSYISDTHKSNLIIDDPNNLEDDIEEEEILISSLTQMKNEFLSNISPFR